MEINSDITSFDEFYRKNYKDNIVSDKERERKVGELMYSALRNDGRAIGEIVELVIDPSFRVVLNVLKEAGNLYLSIDLLEDMMQEIPEIMRARFFRGIPEKVAEEELLKYLLGTVKNSIREILRKNYEKEAKNPSLEQRIENGFPELAVSDWEDSDELWEIKNDMITYFIDRVMNTTEEPHKVITYCYASLLPMIFKSTQNEEVLKVMDGMSGRKYKEKTSGYRWNEKKQKFELYGEIARKSNILMKWAFDAMYDMTVEFLQEEVQDTYNMEPVGGAIFAWGDEVRDNLQKDYDNTRKKKDIVITSEFDKNTIKNWPVRFGISLYEKTRKHFMTEEYYDEVVAEYGGRKKKDREGDYYAFDR